MLGEEFDCLAVPLPASFQEDVERAIKILPSVTAVLQEEPSSFTASEWTPESDMEDDEDEPRACSYVPIDPCQPVIAALRIAMQERMPRAFVDLETARFQPRGSVLPDPYALKQLPIEKFAAGILPGIPAPEGQAHDRILTMAARLAEFEQRFERVLFVCEFAHWPWGEECVPVESREWRVKRRTIKPVTLNSQLSTLNSP